MKPAAPIVATNKADDCTEQGGNESRNAEKAEYPEQQNTMVANVSRDRDVGSICASMVHATDGYVACGCEGSITKKQRSDVVHLNVDRSRYDNERSRHAEPRVNPAHDQLMRQIHKRYQNKAFT